MKLTVDRHCFDKRAVNNVCGYCRAIKTKSWLNITCGFIPRKIQWHIHTGRWSLVNWVAQSAYKTLYKRHMNINEMACQPWGRHWPSWWSVYQRDTPTAISLEQLLTSFHFFHTVRVGGDAREPIGILAITNTHILSLVLLGSCYVSCIHGICPCSNNLETTCGMYSYQRHSVLSLWYQKHPTLNLWQLIRVNCWNISVNVSQEQKKKWLKFGSELLNKNKSGWLHTGF